MKVSKALELLKHYKPDDEIIIEWWDAENFELVDKDGCDVPLVPREVWNAYAAKHETSDYVVEQVHEDIRWGLQDYFWELLGEVK